MKSHRMVEPRDTQSLQVNLCYATDYHGILMVSSSEQTLIGPVFEAHFNQKNTITTTYKKLVSIHLSRSTAHMDETHGPLDRPQPSPNERRLNPRQVEKSEPAIEVTPQ